MVKSKRISKSTVIILALSILLVLSMILGLTGAWFTDSKTSESRDAINLKFGSVNYSISCTQATVKNGEATAEQYNGDYMVVAGTTIETGFTLTNNSTVGTYYMLKAGSKYYVLDFSNNALLEVTNENKATVYGNKSGLGFKAQKSAAAGDAQTIGLVFTLKQGTDEGSGASFDTNTGIWAVTSNGSPITVSNVTATVHFGDQISLGNYLFNQTFQLRAIQADNLTGDVYTVLTGLFS